MPVEPKVLASKLKERFGPAVELLPDSAETTLQVQPEKFLAVVEELAGAFNMLLDLTAVDWPDYFEVVYFLWAVPEARQMRLKVRLLKDRPEIPSVSKIWPAAICMEREAYDLMGIVFVGHPDLRRILCPEDFAGHPLRKDFALEEVPRWE